MLIIKQLKYFCILPIAAILQYSWYTFWKYYNNLCRNHEIYSHEENFLKQIHLSKTKFDQISSIESLFPFYNKFFCMTFTLFKIFLDGWVETKFDTDDNKAKEKKERKYK